MSVLVHIWLRVRLVLFPSLLLACEPAPPPTLVCVCETLSKTLGAISTSTYSYFRGVSPQCRHSELN